MSNTAKQEDCSILFFKEHCDKKFKLSDKQYAELDKKAFGKSGVYPRANAVWKRSYDEFRGFFAWTSKRNHCRC